MSVDSKLLLEHVAWNRDSACLSPACALACVVCFILRFLYLRSLRKIIVQPSQSVVS